MRLIFSSVENCHFSTFARAFLPRKRGETAFSLRDGLNFCPISIYLGPFPTSSGGQLHGLVTSRVNGKFSHPTVGK